MTWGHWGCKRLPVKAQALLSRLSTFTAPSTQVRGGGWLCLRVTHPGSGAGQSAFSSPAFGGQARSSLLLPSLCPGWGLLHSWQKDTRHAEETASGWQQGDPDPAPGLCSAAPEHREHLYTLGLHFPICTLGSLVKTFSFGHTLKSAGGLLKFQGLDCTLDKLNRTHWRVESRHPHHTLQVISMHSSV